MKRLVSGLIFFCSLMAHAAEPMTIQVAPTTSQFSVKLRANPTTGYQWLVVNYDKSLLKLIGSKYLAPKTKLIGAGGVMMFDFKVISGKRYPKSTKIVFKYARPWEPKSGTLKRVIIVFK